MSLVPPRSRPRRLSIATEEERAWVGFYHRVGHDPAIAAEVMTQLEADPEMKRQHLALYLCCRESLRLHEAREQRNARIGSFVRRVFSGLFIELPRAFGRKARRGSDIAVACLPEVAEEPARAQVRRLAGDVELGSAHASFTASAPSAAHAARTPAVTVAPSARAAD